jgi:uncharacterized peroxidase-related enzyme
MSRIPLATPEQMTPEIAALVAQVEEQTGDSSALRALAHRPDILGSFAQFYWALQTTGQLDRKLVELFRLAIAQINQCANCLAGRYQDSIDQGLTEEMIAALPGAESSDLFTDREKAAIVFAQKMAFDHYSVGDADFARLYEHFTVEEVVELNVCVAQFIGIGRMFSVIDAMNTACAVPGAQVPATA